MKNMQQQMPRLTVIHIKLINCLKCLNQENYTKRTLLGDCSELVVIRCIRLCRVILSLYCIQILVQNYYHFPILSGTIGLEYLT